MTPLDQLKADLDAAIEAALAESLNEIVRTRTEAKAQLAHGERAWDQMRVRAERAETRVEALEAERDQADETQYETFHATDVKRLREALLLVDDALVNGDAPEVAKWHLKHSESSADDCLVCVVRAALGEQP